MKKTILFYCLIIAFTSNAQNIIKKENCIDTLVVVFKKYSHYDRSSLANLYTNSYCVGDSLFFYNKLHAKKTLSYLAVQNQYICDEKTPTYTIFVTKKNKLIAEGYWNIEIFFGKYKEYYKTGKIKTEGVYKNGFKINIWKYYNDDGKLIKEEHYGGEEQYEKEELLKTIHYKP